MSAVRNEPGRGLAKLGHKDFQRARKVSESAATADLESEGTSSQAGGRGHDCEGRMMGSGGTPGGHLQPGASLVPGCRVLTGQQQR